MLVLRTQSGRSKTRPSNPYVTAELTSLEPGGVLVLERVDEEPGDWYVQVWMREADSFQLEHRDGVPSAHYQTRTDSRDKVKAAVLSWMNGDPTWRDPFTWDDIGSWFADGQADASA